MQIFFLALVKQHPKNAVMKTVIPIMRSDKAYPVWLISIFMPKFVESFGIPQVTCQIPIAITKMLVINMSKEINAMQ